MSEQELDPESKRRRRLVGILAILGVVGGGVGIYYAGTESVWAAASLRVGILLSSIWLALPAKKRPAAWASLSRWKLIGIIIATLLISRLKVLLPVLAAGFLLGWIIRPRKKKA